MPKTTEQFLNDDDGVTVIEYALIAGLISVVAIGAFTDAGAAVNTVMTSIQTTLAGLVK